MSTRDGVHDLDFCIEGNARIADGICDRLGDELLDLKIRLENGHRSQKETKSLAACIKESRELMQYLCRIQGMIVAQDHVNSLLKAQKMDGKK